MFKNVEATNHQLIDLESSDSGTPYRQPADRECADGKSADRDGGEGQGTDRLRPNRTRSGGDRRALSQPSQPIGSKLRCITGIVFMRWHRIAPDVGSYMLGLDA